MVESNSLILDEYFERESIKRLANYLCLYEGCQNKLGIIPLTLAGYPQEIDFRNDEILRSYLKEWGQKIQSDSLMVLLGDPRKAEEQGHHFQMYVFEPNGNNENNLPGSFSTMCGNGIRAVAAYVKKFDPLASSAKIMTMSGLRHVTIEKDAYTVNMGEFTSKANDLKKYINHNLVQPNKDDTYFDSKIPDDILSTLPDGWGTNTWYIGLTGDRNEQSKLDGEPHVVIEMPSIHVNDIETLKDLAIELGPKITKHIEYFPKEINANFVVKQEEKDDILSVLCCTHERNLGDDAMHSVTASCGTGSTVAGAIMFEKYGGYISIVRVHCSGGELDIFRDTSIPNTFFLRGPANECERCW